MIHRKIVLSIYCSTVPLTLLSSLHLHLYLCGYNCYASCMVPLAYLYNPPIAGHSATCIMDIFSLGCVYYYMLTLGRHPFGEEDKREVSTSSPSSHSRVMSEGETFTDR